MIKEGKRFIFKRELNAALLIIAMLCSLTSCMPKWYTDEDIAKFEKDGKAEVTRWLEKNIPDAKLDKGSIRISYDSFGLDDIVYGKYELDGEVKNFMYVRGSKDMYTDEMYHTASEAVAEMYAEGFGLKNYKIKDSEDSYDVTFYVEYKKYADKKGDGNFEVSDEDSFFKYLPYDLTEDDLEDYLETESKRCGRFHGSGCKYILDTDKITVQKSTLKYLRDHPFFDSFEIYNRKMDEMIMLKVESNKENDAPETVEIWYYSSRSSYATASDGEPVYRLERDYTKTKVYDFNTLTLKQD